MTEAQGAALLAKLDAMTVHLAELQRVQWLQAEALNWCYLALLTVAFFSLVGGAAEGPIMRAWLGALAVLFLLAASARADYHGYSYHVTWVTQTNVDWTEYKLSNFKVVYDNYGAIPARFIPGYYDGVNWVILGTATYPATWGAVAGAGYSNTSTVDFLALMRAAGLPPGSYQVGFAFQVDGGYGYGNRAMCAATMTLVAPPPEPEPTGTDSKTGLNSPEAYREGLYGVIVCGLGASVFAWVLQAGVRRFAE